MKKVVLIMTAAVFTTLIACKNETKETSSNPEVANTEVSLEYAQADIAMADPIELNVHKEEYMYVTASSGLSLRKHGNLHSDKLGRMPYGTKVRVLNAEKDATMNVAGIRGGMNQVEFNHKNGFAFNGYLSKYFPPERDISAKGYATDLNAQFPKVIYTTTIEGTTSKPINKETISLPNAKWHEAFFMAQRLYDFPKDFVFPNPKGKNTETVFDSKPKKGIWVSQLDVTRKFNELEKIEYVYNSKGFSRSISIIKEGDAMKITSTETIN